jgi:hypothetical protein
LHVDFYDRNRIATWTQSHPGLAIWVREKVGRGLQGWRPYESWASSPDGLEDQYLLDEKTRLHCGRNDATGMDVLQGINQMRDILRNSRSVIRLVGLSGVGKTRLVQSFFDARVGNNALDPNSVLYTELGYDPSAMASDLLASRKRAILVVDNCGPELHRRITEVCQRPESRLSAITIEYDVQDDEPEGTDVFRLEPSSIKLLYKLIARHRPTMTGPDIERVAEFSGGNARVALALARSVERN